MELSDYFMTMNLLNRNTGFVEANPMMARAIEKNQQPIILFAKVLMPFVFLYLGIVALDKQNLWENHQRFFKFYLLGFIFLDLWMAFIIFLLGWLTLH